MYARIGGYLLFGIVASVTFGCAGSGATGDDYTLVANPPGLGTVSPTITKNEYHKDVYERHQWTYQPVGWPAADLLFARIKDNFRGSFLYARDKTLPEHIDTYFPDWKITLGSGGTTSNAVGELGYQHFDLDSVAACIFVEQGVDRVSELVEFRSNNEPLGDMFILGWYCVGSTEPAGDIRFRKFIDSIGIQGYAEPDTS